VRIWESVPFVNGKSCDITLGDVGVPGVGPTRFNSPEGVAWSGGDLIVCDAGNNRVLRFENPRTNGQAAANVIGQTNFSNSGAAKTSSRLAVPSACAVFDGILLVSDSSNNRVLRWNTVPITNGVAANVVIGQSGFGLDVTGSAANRFSFPRGIAVSPTTGRLYVADQLNNRVSIFASIPAANNVSAVRVLGYPAFGNVPSGASNTTLNQPIGVSVSLVGFVAVTSYRSTKVWYDEPAINGAAAHAILGQVNFDTSLNWGNVSGTPDDKGFVYPMGLHWNGNDLLVADPFGKRTLIFKP
jgi:DNA-binding beta-propeller fold protein YncE